MNVCITTETLIGDINS